MKCSKLLKDALEGIEDKVSDKDYGLQAVYNWIKHSGAIVKAYLKTGKHKELDEFFKSVTPDYKGTTSRIGMIDKDLVNRLKDGDYTTNTFPFATSVNSEENDIFSSIVAKRLLKHPDKIKVRYEIDNYNVLQYDLRHINPAETEVLIKPDTAFVVDSIDRSNDDLVIIKLSATRNRRNKATIPLLSAAVLLPLANKTKERQSQ